MRGDVGVGSALSPGSQRVLSGDGHTSTRQARDAACVPPRRLGTIAA